MPIPFPNAPAVPIVGQPLTVISATLLPLVQCNCERGGSLVLVARLNSNTITTAPDACPSCGRVFVLRGFAQNAQGQFTYAIDVSEPPARAS